jgi:hypothetical protein
MTDERLIWTSARDGLVRTCVMISCCSGAELQIRDDGRIVLRELYPDKPTLYERARDLKDAWEAVTAPHRTP